MGLNKEVGVVKSGVCALVDVSLFMRFFIKDQGTFLLSRFWSLFAFHDRFTFQGSLSLFRLFDHKVLFPFGDSFS